MTSAWSQAGNRNANFQLGDSSNLDAFGRLRVSQPFSLNISKFEYSVDHHYWPVLITGAATENHLPNESTVQLDVTAAAGDKIIKQSKYYNQYQAGNSQQGMPSTVFGDHQSGIRKRVGYFDNNNGLFFEQYNGEYAITLRTSTSGSPVDTERIVQSDWNIDHFQYNSSPKDDPENPSKKNFDFSKSFIFFVDIEWLGVGRVRCGFVIDGISYYAHEFNNAGIKDKVYMATASLPLRYEIENIGGTNAGSLKQICSTVKSEGGAEVFGVPHTAYRSFYDAVAVPDTSASTGAYTPILSIRPRQTFHSKDFRGIITPVEFEVFVEGNFPVELILVHDGTLTKGAGVPLVAGDWTPIADEAADVPSATEYTLVPNAIDISTGHVHNLGFASADVKGAPTPGGDIITRLFLANGIDITDRTQADTYTIAARAKGGSADCSAVIRVAEVR